jgi:hypothetical protein
LGALLVYQGQGQRLELHLTVLEMVWFELVLDQQQSWKDEMLEHQFPKVHSCQLVLLHCLEEEAWN